MLRELSDDALDIIAEFAGRVPSPRTAVILADEHGAARRVAPTATATPHRDGSYFLLILSMWDDPAADETNITWTRELAAAIKPCSTGGVYVNQSWDEKTRPAFGVNYERLIEIKKRYDPTNFFRHNANIPPAS